MLARTAAPVAVGTSRQMLIERIQQEIDIVLARVESHWESGRPEDQYLRFEQEQAR
ncbi:hypothetical protein [Nocardia sp. NPDC049149]|uniref:hypothetical protein n=1 Tax=Nocardia sp. NPDC049149 TaxID=3364315 RepID=UPI00370F7B2B